MNWPCDHWPFARSLQERRVGASAKRSWSLLMKVSRFACQWAIHAPSQPLSTPKTGSWKASACKTKTLNALKTASLFFFYQGNGTERAWEGYFFPWKDQHIYGSWGFTANRRAPAFRLRISWSVTAKRIWGNRQQKQDQKAESKTILISNVQCYSSGKWPFKKSKVVKNCHQTFATYAKESFGKSNAFFDFCWKVFVHAQSHCKSNWLGMARTLWHWIWFGPNLCSWLWAQHGATMGTYRNRVSFRQPLVCM